MKHKNTGFTLIEILIALFIFAIIALIISVGLHSVFNTKQQVQKHQQRLNELQIALLLFQRDVTQIGDYPIYNNDSISSSITATNDSFTFDSNDNSNPLSLEKRSNIIRVHYFFKKGQLLRQTWLPNGYDKPKHVISRVLYSHIRHGKFRYLGEGGFDNKWPSPNQSKPGPPLAVQIQMDVPGWGHLSQIYRIRGTAIAN